MRVNEIQRRRENEKTVNFFAVRELVLSQEKECLYKVDFINNQR